MALIGQAVSEEKMFKHCWRQGQRRRTPEQGYTISSPCEPHGSGELKSTTMIECACWKVDNTGFVSHLTEEAWLTVSNIFYDPLSFGCFSNFHSHHLIIPLWFSNFKNNTLFLIFKQCHMTSLKFEIQIFQYFWVRQLAYQQHYVASGLQNIKMSHLVMGTDKEKSCEAIKFLETEIFVSDWNTIQNI